MGFLGLSISGSWRGSQSVYWGKNGQFLAFLESCWAQKLPAHVCVCVCVCSCVNAAVAEISFSGNEKPLHWWSKSPGCLDCHWRNILDISVLCYCCATTHWRGGCELGDMPFIMSTSDRCPPLFFKLRLRISLHIMILALMTLQEKIVFTYVGGQISVLFLEAVFASIVFLNCPGRCRNRDLPRCSPKHVSASG